ncbi:MAG: type III pantothenate kinase [Candidatus Brocadiaceae bacterium]|nr:type III pantothenate kinase [Candidatus Brocadiaceae bacterium]
MWLALDIGNTNVHIGVFDGKDLQSTHSVKSAPLDAVTTGISAIMKHPAYGHMQAIIVSSVHPKAEAVVVKYFLESFRIKPQIIGKDIPLPLSVLTEKPETVGADRLLNALAAFEHTKTRTVIVDAGTAITIDGVNERGDFLGGVIVPGMEIASKALGEHTSLLPTVSICKPGQVLGKNTVSAINSGVYWGTIGMVRYLITLLCEELEYQPSVIVTGGYAEILAPEIESVTAVSPHLTLKGIRIAYEKNKILPK